MNLVKHLALGLAVLLLSTACETPQKKPNPKLSTQVPDNTGAPTIKSLSDLGSLPLQVGGELPWAMSDGRFSPGEWVLVKGINLGVTELQVNERKVAVPFYYDGSPVIRLPTGLQPLNTHKLQIEHSLGSSAKSFHSSHYLVATDTDGKKRHLIRTNPEAEGGVEEDWLELASDAPRPLYTLVSANSAYFYTVNIAERVADDGSHEANAYVMNIRSYHAAAPNAPVLLKQFSVVVDSSPIDATISQNDEIVLLGKRSFTVIDASDPLNVAEKKRVWLPESGLKKTTYVDVIYFNHQQTLAFLETYSNQVLIYDTRHYEQQRKLNVLPEKAIALSVDLEPDPLDPTQFWALLGPNYRLSGTKLVEQYKKWVKKEDTPPENRSVHQLVKLKWKNGVLTEQLRHELDSEYAAYFAKADSNGDVVITTTKLKFLTSNLNNKSRKEMLKMTRAIVWDALSFGRVVKVDGVTGEMATLASGVGIYYDLELVPGIGPVFSLMKFGPSFSVPFITPNWGVGVKSTGTYAKRKMNKYAVFPPYSVGHIAYQR